MLCERCREVEIDPGKNGRRKYCDECKVLRRRETARNASRRYHGKHSEAKMRRRHMQTNAA